MNKISFEAKLLNDCPYLYAQMYAPMTSVVAGIYISEGWQNLVYELSVKIENLIRTRNDRDNIYVLNIKSKFASLRFDISSSSSDLEELISAYELQSQSMCEVCGKPGKRNIIHNWLYVSCDEHIRVT